LNLEGIKDFFSLLVEASKVFSERTLFQSLAKDQYSFKYKRLEAFILGLDSLFEEKEIPPNSAIGVMLPNDLVTALLFLGIPALDRIFVPVNPKLSKEEISYICKDAGIIYMITLDSLKKFIPSNLDYLLIDLGSIWVKELLLRGGSKSIDRLKRVNENHIAEIVYTSGTTGNPKGVELSHRNLISNSKGISSSFKFTSEDRFLTITPLFHNSGQLFTTLAPIWTGGLSIPVRPEIALGGFWDLISNKSITWTLGMGSHINFFLSNIKSNNSPKHKLKGIVTGGMKLDAQKRKLFEKSYKTKILITYGLTETTSFATCDTLFEDIVSGSVGKPMKVNQIRIDSEDGQEGEVLIKGENVFERYHNLPELTAKKKIKGWLKTGDLGYLDKSGYLFITDRIDNLIIVSGENVYPAEIEQYSHLFPDLYEFLIVGKDHAIKGMEVVMIYTLSNNAFADEKSWSKIFSSKLANYKIPSRYINVKDLGLEEIPKSANGKILRNKVYKLVNNYS
jgi:acyl-CoA synthetase (AMP-forming)/AMP-acid ligase II